MLNSVLSVEPSGLRDLTPFKRSSYRILFNSSAIPVLSKTFATHACMRKATRLGAGNHLASLVLKETLRVGGRCAVSKEVL